MTARARATTRRSILAAAGTGALAAGSGGAAAKLAPAAVTATVREKGPRVWLDMDQAELDAAYDQSKYAPNQQQVGRRRNRNSEAAIQRLGPPRSFAYG